MHAETSSFTSPGARYKATEKDVLAYARNLVDVVTSTAVSSLTHLPTFLRNFLIVRYTFKP